MGQDVSTLRDQSRPHVHQLVERLSQDVFPDGMPWGATFSELETIAAEVGDEVARRLLEAHLQRQAEDTPQQAQDCPLWGRPTSHAPEHPRAMSTTRGEVAWVEPGRYCPRCRRAFFPSEPSLGY